MVALCLCCLVFSTAGNIFTKLLLHLHGVETFGSVLKHPLWDLLTESPCVALLRMWKECTLRKDYEYHKKCTGTRNMSFNKTVLWQIQPATLLNYRINEEMFLVEQNRLSFMLMANALTIYFKARPWTMTEVRRTQRITVLAVTRSRFSHVSLGRRKRKKKRRKREKETERKGLYSQLWRTAAEGALLFIKLAIPC